MRGASRAHTVPGTRWDRDGAGWRTVFRPTFSNLLLNQSGLARESQCLLEPCRLGFRDLAASVAQPVVTAPLGVLFRIGPFVEFNDEPLIQETADRGVQRAGIQFETAAGPCCNILHDGVSMAVALRERNQDVERSLRQRQHGFGIEVSVSRSHARDYIYA